MQALTTLQQVWWCTHTFGLGETLTRALRRLKGVEVAHSLCIFLLDLKEPAPARRPFPREMVTRELTKEALAACRIDEDLPALDRLQAEFTRGARLFGVLRGQDLLAINWVTDCWGDLAYVRRPRVTFPEGTAYTYGARVAAPYRRLGIGTLLKQEVIAAMRKEGYDRVVLAANIADPGVLEWHRLNGFRLWGSIRYLRWRGRDLWWTRRTPLGRRLPHLLSF